MAGEDEEVAAGRVTGDVDPDSVEWAKCSADAAYFLDTYGVVDDAQGHGDGSGTIPLKLWPAQVDVVWTLMIERLVVILKARQLGISWLVCGYVLWICLFNSGKVVLLFSRGELEAIELLRRVRALYDRLPAWLRGASPLAGRPNASEMGWANGSRVLSLPATKNAGSSFTASLVVMDEAAKIQFADDLLTAVQPTIDGGGQLVVLSSAWGVGGTFHRVWTRAVAGTNGFRPIFLPWWSRPGRDMAWREARTAAESEPGKAGQEYPGSPTEAFLVSGRARFAAQWISSQEANRLPPLPPDQLPVELGPMCETGLKVYAFPVQGRRYVVAADVAEGLEGGDYSSAVAIDADSWEEMADDHGHWEPDEFAARLKALAIAFKAAVVVERNNHGHAVLATLKALDCPKVAAGADGRPGWLTNVQTKPQAVDALAVALRDRLAKVRTAATLDEMLIYRIGPNGNTSAPPGFHDDRVMKWAVALGWLKVVGFPVAPPPAMAGGYRPTYTPPFGPASPFAPARFGARHPGHRG